MTENEKLTHKRDEPRETGGRQENGGLIEQAYLAWLGESLLEARGKEPW